MMAENPSIPGQTDVKVGIVSGTDMPVIQSMIDAIKDLQQILTQTKDQQTKFAQEATRQYADTHNVAAAGGPSHPEQVVSDVETKARDALSKIPFVSAQHSPMARGIFSALRLGQGGSMSSRLVQGVGQDIHGDFMDNGRSIGYTAGYMDDSMGYGPGGGISSGGGSRPPLGGVGGLPIGMDYQALDVPMGTPRYGKWTVQDFLRTGALRQLRRAGFHSQEDVAKFQEKALERQAVLDEMVKNGEDISDEKSAQAYAVEALDLDPKNFDKRINRAGALNALAGFQGEFSQYHQMFGQVRGAVQSAYGGHAGSPGVIQQQGGGFGLSPQGVTIGGSGFGFELPISQYFSEAGQEGIRKQIEEIGLRLKPNINKEQAQAITESIQQAGFKGDMATGIAEQYAAPLTQKYGYTPEQLQPFMRLFREGMPVDEVTKALSDLADTAKKSDVNLDAMTQSMDYFINQGWNPKSAKSFSVQSAGLYNIPGQSLGPALENGMTQGITTAMTGLPPNMQGALSGGSRMAGLEQTMQTLYGAYRSANITSDRPIMVDGKKMGTQHVTADESAIAAVAQNMGLSIQEVRNFIHPSVKRKQLLRRQALDDLTDEYEDSFDKKGMDKWVDKKMSGFGYRTVHTKFGDRVVKKNRKDFEEQYIREHPGKNWANIDAVLKKSGLNKDVIRDIEKAAPNKRASMIKKAIAGDQNKKNMQRIHIEATFKGDAAKFFKFLQTGVATIPFGGSPLGAASSAAGLLGLPNPLGMGVGAIEDIASDLL